MQQKYLDPLFHLLEIKSVSTLPEYEAEMAKARHYLVDLFSAIGFETKILKGKKHAAVFAQLITNHLLPTILIYGHYDVQPPEPIEDWQTEPFKPTVKGNILHARGATDNKGQFMVHLMAIKKLLEKGKPPVNFKFILEGEEEIGSPSVLQIAKRYKKLLSADYIFVSDSEMIRAGQPSIEISLRGLTYAEVTIEVAKQDLHSGHFGGVAENPAMVLTRIINQLKDKNNKITIPGFYKDVIAPSKKELKDYNLLSTKKEEIIEEGNLLGIGGGESEFSLNERRWTRPTLEINGLTSGYQGPGSKTIIPAKASAKISMRLVPNQNPDKIYKLFENYVKKLAPKTVKVTIEDHAGGLPYKAPTDHPVFEVIKKSLKKVFGKEALFSATGGTIGFVPILAGALKVPCIMVGWGLPGENLHAPNEHFSLENYEKGMETMVDFYQNLSRLTNRSAK